MQDTNPEEKMYSRIIYKTPDDPELQRILAAKAKSSSPRKYKRWSPEISYEERTLRKKQREENYIRKIYPEERPILLVKRKQKFKNLENPNLIGSVPNQENNFKITRNTELLVDVDRDIEQNKKFIRRFTVVHDKKAEQPASPRNKNIYKVEGVEYLPEGFLELDPLLLKDEYYFESPILEEMFRKEQRKLKALRRRQYAEKNYQKKRDVTIYVIEDYKDKVIEFLDLWFDKYQRKMTRAELEEVSRRLDTSYENLQKLQDLYLKRKRLLRNKELKEANITNGKDWTKAEMVAATPREIREYLKNKDKYGHVESKVKKDPLGKSKWRYSPMYVEKYNLKRNKNSRPLSVSHSASRVGKGSVKSRPVSRKEVLLNRGLRGKARLTTEEVSSVDNTFYMLSKTNNEDANQSREMSNVGKSFRGKYDKLVEDFEDLIQKRKVGGPEGHISSQSQLERRIPRQSQPKTQSQMVRPQRETFQGELRPQEDHRKEIAAYNQIIQEQLRKNANQGQMVRMAEHEGQDKQPDRNYDSDLNMYFDTEINQILDKIKKCRVEGVTDCDVHMGPRYKLMNCTNSLRKGELADTQLQRPLNTGTEPEYRQSTNEYNEVESRRNTKRVREMFEERDIEDLKNRGKAYTKVEVEGPPKERSKTFQAKLMTDQVHKPLVAPEVHREAEFEGEIEFLKRKTIHETTPRESPKSSVDPQVPSRPSGVESRNKSQNSGNFSFNPRSCKANMNSKMNEMIDQMDIDPLKKHVTVSMVVDDFERPVEPRDKALTAGAKGSLTRHRIAAQRRQNNFGQGAVADGEN